MRARQLYQVLISRSIKVIIYVCLVKWSWKSTLIKTLLNLIDKVSGRIEYGDGLKDYEIGYLPQQTVVQKDFPATVWEVVLSGTLAGSGFKPFYGKKEKSLAIEKMRELDITDLKKNVTAIFQADNSRGSYLQEHSVQLPR